MRPPSSAASRVTMRSRFRSRWFLSTSGRQPAGSRRRCDTMARSFTGGSLRVVRRRPRVQGGVAGGDHSGQQCQGVGGGPRGEQPQQFTGNLAGEVADVPGGPAGGAVGGGGRRRQGGGEGGQLGGFH